MVAERRPIRALSLTQPWASLVVAGHKRWETRSWRTDYRGPVAIHAAKGQDVHARGVEQQARSLRLVWAGALPRGQVIGVVTLLDCVPVEDVREQLPASQTRFGDFTDGRYAWKFTVPVWLGKPFELRGRLGLWRLSPAAAAAIARDPCVLEAYGTVDRLYRLAGMMNGGVG